MSSKKPFVKINIEDLVYAKEFFDNVSDYTLWLYAVTEFYQGKEVLIKKKIVKKYFDNYKKTMNIVIEAKKFGAEGYLKRVENQKDNLDTLKDPHKPTLKETHRVNNKEVNNKEIIDSAFDLFWDAYDKKVGRDKCYSIFSKIKPELYETIINQAKQYNKATPDKQFRKHPATWLNGKHWEDEIKTDEPKMIKAFHPIIFD